MFLNFQDFPELLGSFNSNHASKIKPENHKSQQYCSLLQFHCSLSPMKERMMDYRHQIWYQLKKSPVNITGQNGGFP